MAALCGCLSAAICLVACALAEMGTGPTWVEHAIAGLVTALFSLLSMRWPGLRLVITGEALILLALSLLPAHDSAPHTAAGVLAAAVFFGLSLADPIAGTLPRARR